MSRRDGIRRCVWCGEPGDQEHPIIDYDSENWHQFCVEQRLRQIKKETGKKNGKNKRKVLPLNKNKV